MFNSVNTYGDRSERLPDRLADAHKSLFRGSLSPSAVRTELDAAGNLTAPRDFTDNRRRLGSPHGQ